MSELKPGDIRIDCGQVYLVVTGGSPDRFVRVWLHNNPTGGLDISMFPPDGKDRLLCNIQPIFKSIRDKVDRGVYD